GVSRTARERPSCHRARAAHTVPRSLRGRPGSTPLGRRREDSSLRALAALGQPLLVVRLVDALVDGRLGEQEREPAGADRLLGDDALADVGSIRYVVHHLEKRLLDDRAERPGTRLAIERDLGGRLERARGERQLDLVERQELLELPRDRIL